MTINLPEAEGTTWIRVSVVRDKVVKEVLADASEFLECDVDSECLIELFKVHVTPIIGLPSEVKVTNTKVLDVSGGRIIEYEVQNIGKILVIIHRADIDPLKLVS